jgi:hypothetical protein
MLLWWGTYEKWFISSENLRSNEGDRLKTRKSHVQLQVTALEDMPLELSKN